MSRVVSSSRPVRRTTAVALVAALAVPSLLALGGCAEMERRYREGPKWQAEDEAMKRELERQGFPQYSPPL